MQSLLTHNGDRVYSGQKLYSTIKGVNSDVITNIFKVKLYNRLQSIMITKSTFAIIRYCTLFYIVISVY